MSVDFYDSNVFIYLFDAAAEGKRLKAGELVRSAHENHTACISFQIVQETLNVLTRKLATPVTPEHAKDFLRETLIPLVRVWSSERLYVEALRLKGRYGFSFYDSLIVAAALEAGCKRLLTEDLQNGQRIEGLRIENPFQA